MSIPSAVSLSRRQALALSACSLGPACLPALAQQPAALAGDAQAERPAADWQAWHPGRPVSDRAYWEGPAALARRGEWVAEADRLLKKGLPTWDDEAYQAFARQGQRSFDGVMGTRQKGCSSLFLAYAATREARYAIALAEWIRAVVRQRTWVLGAHDPKLQTFRGEKAYVDLHAATLVHDLSLTLVLMGSDWEPDLQAEARQAIRTRALDPVLKSLRGEDKAHWWLGSPYNWIAVCLSGIAGAAMALEQDPSRRAALAQGCAKGGRYYLESYGEDGYCEEGVSYWNYGFSHFLNLRQTLWGASAGQVELMAAPRALAAARYGQRVTMADGQVAAFGDAVLGSQPAAGLLLALQPWLGGAGPSASSPPNPGPKLVGELMLLDQCQPKSPSPTASVTPRERVTHFEDADIWVMRSHDAQGLSMTFKAGAKGRSHQHHDWGSYALSLGGEQPCGDPGGPRRYEARTFNAQRFESPLMNSLGHPVPGPVRQKATGQAQARVRQAVTEGDDTRVTLDLTQAYDWPGLESLTREAHHDARGRGQATITDTVRFAQASAFETTVVTDRLTVQSDGTHQVTRGQQPLVMTVQADVPVTLVTEALNDQGTSWTVVRIRASQPVTAARIAVRFSPVSPA